MSISDYRRIAREKLENNWSLTIGVTLVAFLLGGVLVSGPNLNVNISDRITDVHPIIATFIAALASAAGILSLAQLIVGGNVQLGYAQFLLKLHKGEGFDFNDLFSQFHRIKQGFIQSLLRGLYIILWTLLFIIPGIVKGYAYSMTPFIMADHPQMTPSEAITASRELMDGHKFELFVLDLSFIGWNLLGIFTLGIGLIWVIPYHNAAYAAFYRNLSHD